MRVGTYTHSSITMILFVALQYTQQYYSAFICRVDNMCARRTAEHYISRRELVNRASSRALVKYLR